MDKYFDYKKILIIIIKIAIAVFLLVALNAVFMPKYIFENQDGRITREYYREKLDTDVIFAGSSTVYSGISPIILWRDYGITSFVRSNASQPTWVSYYMIKDAIKRNKPKLVVCDVGFAKYEDTYSEEPANRKAIDGMRLSKEKIDCIKATMGEDEKLLDYIFPIFRFHSRWKELSLDDFKYAFYSEPVSHNGYLVNYESNPMDMRRNMYDYREEPYLGSRGVFYLNEIVDLCKENDIEVLLIKMPGNYENWSDAYDNQIMEEICSRSGCGYTNFDRMSDVIGLDYMIHSSDGGQHLNTPGAEVFSEYLGNVLKEYYELPDHRDDDKYVKAWETKLGKYESEKALKQLGE